MGKSNKSMFEEMKSSGSPRDENSWKSLKKKIIIKMDIYNRFYSRWKQFNNMPQYDQSIPWVGISGPYMSEQEQINKEYKENKRKWICQKDFQRIFGRKSSQENSKYVPNYVSLAPSNPPILHKFREEDRQKWINNSGFFP